jgi:hypothetical protein
MTSLKSFLQGVAPILGVSLATLYERQRALVRLGVLPPSTGAGPGSGVPFTAENFAAILISLLASDSLSDVDQSMVALFKAKPEKTFSWVRHEKRSHGGLPPTSFWSELTPRGKPTFLRDVALVLSGYTAKVPREEHEEAYEPVWYIGDITGVRVSRVWRGQIVVEVGDSSFIASYHSSKNRPARAISITAEIEEDMLNRLISFTKDALSQPKGLDPELGPTEEKDDAR